MFITGRRIGAIASVAVAALALAACSSSGGRQESSSGLPPRARPTPRDDGRHDHPRGPRRHFWDMIRKGAEAAAAKDNVKLVYSNDPTRRTRPTWCRTRSTRRSTASRSPSPSPTP